MAAMGSVHNYGMHKVELGTLPLEAFSLLACVFDLIP